MPIIEILETLVLALLQPGDEGPVEGPDFPFTYVHGHPSFQTAVIPANGPYRIVAGKDRLHYTAEKRRKVVFQLPK